MESDTYLTIKSFSQGLYKEKGSRFVSFAYPVFSLEQIKPVIDKIKKEHHDARHHCYAYMLGQERQVYRTNDDGEPSGTAGRPILGQINSHGLTNILIVVVRYFGGKLLGVSGLINAYRSAADSAIVNGEIQLCTLHDYFELSFPYSSLNDVMKVIKEEEIEQTEHEFDLTCKITISIRASLTDRIRKKLDMVEGMKYLHLSRH